VYELSVQLTLIPFEADRRVLFLRLGEQVMFMLTFIFHKHAWLLLACKLKRNDEK